MLQYLKKVDKFVNTQKTISILFIFQFKIAHEVHYYYYLIQLAAAVAVVVVVAGHF